MKCLYKSLLVAALASAVFISLPTSAATKHVNCDAGQSISHTLETAKGTSGRLEIFVSGECNESFSVRRDQVWITGDPYAYIKGRVNVYSANDVRLNNLTITGPGRGLVVTGGADVITDNVSLMHNNTENLFLRRNAAVWLRNSTIIGDCEDIYDEDCADGVVIVGSTLEVSNSSISNSRYGIRAENGASVRLGAPNGPLTRIINNSVVGVQAALQSNVELIGDTGFYGNRHHSLYLLQGSAVVITSPEVHVDGNIGCQDWMSFIANPGGGYFGSTSCFVL